MSGIEHNKNVHFLPQEVIRKKRDGLALSQAEVAYFVDAIANESISEGQVAAFAMATYFQGMSIEERIALTCAMRDSGDVLSWQDLALDGPILDKHSTGGVGDLVSLVLGPIVAACGGYVPMISGRGLGHTGGTLDKLDAITGYQTQVSNQVFRDCVKEVGLAIIGQSANLAPADKRLYATRDITATVESLDLVTASILSKKLACGLDALVMDVKTGSGAVMKDLESSIELAKSISAVANGAGVKTSCLITDMSQVLATSAGNGLEIAETIAFLTGEKRAGRLAEVIYALADEMLLISGLASSKEEAAKKRMAALDSGAAAQKFAQMVAFLGGPADILEQPDKYLPKAEVVKPVFMPESGYLSSMDTRAIGMAVVDLGGGRKRASDVLDYSVGLNQIAQLGQKLDAKTPVCFVHANSEDAFSRAASRIQSAIQLTEVEPKSVSTLYNFETLK